MSRSLPLQPRGCDPRRMDESAPLGIVAYSFALRRRNEEPNPCNVRIAEQVAALARKHPGSVIVAQWEVALGLARLGVAPDAVVEPRGDGTYLDSNAVWNRAVEVFRPRQVQAVLPVAQRFLQLTKVRRLATRAGFRLEPSRIGAIGFDPSRRNLQWWTRGPVRLLIYAALQGLFGYRGTSKLIAVTGEG